MGCGTSKMALHESRQVQQNSSGIRPIIQRRLDDIKRFTTPAANRIHNITRKDQVLAPAVVYEEEVTAHTRYNSAVTSPTKDHGRNTKGVFHLHEERCGQGNKEMMKMEVHENEMLVKEINKKRTELIQFQEEEDMKKPKEEDKEHEFEDPEEGKYNYNSDEEDEDEGSRQDTIWESLGSPSFRVYCMESEQSTTDYQDFDQEEGDKVLIHEISNDNDIRIERHHEVCEESIDDSSGSNKVHKKKPGHKGMKRRLKTFTTIGGIMHLHNRHAPHNPNKHFLQKSVTV